MTAKLSPRPSALKMRSCEHEPRTLVALQQIRTVMGEQGARASHRQSITPTPNGSSRNKEGTSSRGNQVDCLHCSTPFWRVRTSCWVVKVGRQTHNASRPQQAGWQNLTAFGGRTPSAGQSAPTELGGGTSACLQRREVRERSAHDTDVLRTQKQANQPAPAELKAGARVQRSGHRRARDTVIDRDSLRTHAQANQPAERKASVPARSAQVREPMLRTQTQAGQPVPQLLSCRGCKLACSPGVRAQGARGRPQDTTQAGRPAPDSVGACMQRWRHDTSRPACTR